MPKEKAVQFNEIGFRLRNNMGIIGISLGILSATICCFPLGIPLGAAGLICSILTLKRYSTESAGIQRKMAWGGIICGGIGIILGLITVVSFLILCCIWIKNGGFYL